MFDYIIGNITKRQPTLLILEANGIGYEIRIPFSTYTALPEDGKIKSYIHHYVREDESTLYGFATKDLYEDETYGLILLEKI